MPNSIQSKTLQLWTGGRKTKTVSGGWLAGNAVCCTHNGETQDKRNRGGLILDEAAGSVSWHCFNCGFKTSWRPGWQLGYKFRKLLGWMGASEFEVQQLVLDAIRDRELAVRSGEVTELKEEFKASFVAKPLPESSVSFAEWATLIALSDNLLNVPHSVIEAVEYVNDRCVDMSRYDFYWSSKLPTRVIIPFTWKGEVIGYSARGLIDKVKPKYLHQMDSGYVFNVDKQKDDWEFVVVTEGVFDAIAIDAVAVLHAEINKQQVDLIESLNREVIVVPHVDSAGSKLIDIAVENGWSVSFPTWMETCKDISEATKKYGAPFVLMDIVKKVERSKIKIELMRRRIKL